MQLGITSKLANTLKGPRLSRSSGELKSHRFAECTGDWPNDGIL